MLTDLVKNSEEGRFGADIAVVVQSAEDDAVVTKGMLLQMKRSDRLAAEWPRLQEECARMIAHTPAAFAVVYDPPRGAWTHPATDVVGWKPKFPITRPRRQDARHLFYEFFRCYVGDARVPSLLFDEQTLAADRVLLLQLAPRRSRDAIGWFERERDNYRVEHGPHGESAQ